jgi:hypothetical protein
MVERFISFRMVWHICLLLSHLWLGNEWVEINYTFTLGGYVMCVCSVKFKGSCMDGIDFDFITFHFDGRCGDFVGFTPFFRPIKAK